MTAKNQSSSSIPMTKESIESEIQEDLMIRNQRRRIFPRAALVGLGAGLVASAFRAVLAGSELLRNNLIEWSQRFPVWGWIFPLLFGVLGAILSVFLVRQFAPEASGSGIPHLEAVLHRIRDLNWKRVLPVKFIAGFLAIGSGMALGREGPTVQMGGAVGDAVAKWLKVLPKERRTLIAAGAGSGLAAAFNAPLSGVIFVLEEIQRDFHPLVFGAAFLAAVIADVVARILTDAFPVFSIPDYPTPPTASLPIFAVLGILAGLLGVGFNKGLLGMLNLFSRLKQSGIYLVAATCGSLIGIIGWFNPAMVGSGHSLSETILAGSMGLAAIPLFFLVRFLLTLTSYSTGTAGGIFAPLLVLGALLGLSIGEIGHMIAPDIVPIPAVFAVVGMSAYFTAIVRAPLTGIVLIVEMTGNYRQMLPLLVACFCAYAVAELLKDVPIYEALLERDLIKNGASISIKEPVVLDFIIEHGAPFSGKEVRYLGLPPGCVLVRCVEAGREFVPTAATRLNAHMKITAVIAPDAIEGISMLREGTKEDSRNL